MLIVVDENVAVPFEAVAEAPDAMVPGPVATVRLMVSPLPVLGLVSMLPKLSSTPTVNEPSAVPAVPLEGGPEVKTTLLGAAGLMTVAGVEVAVAMLRDPSVAVKV